MPWRDPPFQAASLPWKTDRDDGSCRGGAGGHDSAGHFLQWKAGDAGEDGASATARERPEHQEGGYVGVPRSLEEPKLPAGRTRAALLTQLIATNDQLPRGPSTGRAGSWGKHSIYSHSPYRCGQEQGRRASMQTRAFAVYSQTSSVSLHMACRVRTPASPVIGSAAKKGRDGPLHDPLGQ